MFPFSNLLDNLVLGLYLEGHGVVTWSPNNHWKATPAPVLKPSSDSTVPVAWIQSQPRTLGIMYGITTDYWSKSANSR